jgi:hypothetical protein
MVIGRASGVRIYYQDALVPLQPNNNDVALIRLQ